MPIFFVKKFVVFLEISFYSFAARGVQYGYGGWSRSIRVRYGDGVIILNFWFFWGGWGWFVV